MRKRIHKSILIALILSLAIAIPVYAIVNPDDISIPSYKVFENVAETGDMLFIAEGLVEYASEPTDYTASEAFLFELLTPTANQTLFARPLNDYGDRPISIYLTASQVTSANLTSGTSYILRIEGNPLIFSSPTGNSANVTLISNDYIDQSSGSDSETPTDNNIRNFLILMAQDIEDYDTPVDEYITDIQGYKYLTNAGGDIFIEGIPNLYNLCPILFQYGAERMALDAPESSGAYASTLDPVNKWGQLTADGLTNIGVFLGINQALAGSVVLFVGAIALAVFVYKKTQSGIAVLLLISAVPFLGGYLGLMPMALAFIFVIFIVVLMGYYFFSRGAL